MKNIDQNEKNTVNGYFWVFGGLLCVLLISVMARDINRPFIGLHSWGEAHGAWAARTHIRYGLGYTKGITTWAVGNPPIENPKRYYDHPQLSVLLTTACMRIVGVDEAGRRITRIILSVMALLLVLKILRGLIDEKTALLAGLLCALFPITGYFGFAEWTMLMGLVSLWFYLVLIRSLSNGPEPGRIHKFGLAASLFLGLQCGWTGFFYAFAIGVHYVARCLFHKRRPDMSLLAILIFAPLLSLVLTFTVMAAGTGWDFQRIVELYKWRSAKGERTTFVWGAWFAQFWEFARTNFTTPVLVAAVLYLTFGQLIVFSSGKSGRQSGYSRRRFPQFWLFLLTPVTQIFALRGALWKHQTWERPFGPFIAIAAAMGIMLLADILKKARPVFAKIATAVIVLIITISCAAGRDYYNSITHFSPEKVKLFTMLNELIPPDKMLLSFETLKVEQHEAKGAHYRPEIAWYLDREVVQAATVSEVQNYAQTGKFPYYLMPSTYYSRETADHLNKLNVELQKRYKVRYVPPDRGGPNQAPMLPYLVFDLNSQGPGSW